MTLRIRQSASFAGLRRLRICRRIENVSAQPVLIYHLDREGDNHQELSVAYYNRRGEWIAPVRPFGGYFHPSFVPPPIPANEDDISIYTVMAPGGHVENCAELGAEPGLDTFQVVTYYNPQVGASEVPARARAGNLVLNHDLSLASQPCLVDLRRRRIDCALTGG